jgi:hypothetical protein
MNTALSPRDPSRQRICLLVERLLASQEVICTMLLLNNDGKTLLQLGVDYSPIFTVIRQYNIWTQKS